MKKPGSRTTSTKKDDGTSTGNKNNSQIVGKALDLGKEALKTGGTVAELFKERQRTEQVRITTQGQVEQAKEVTRRAESQAKVDMASIYSDHLKDIRQHEREMYALETARTESANLNHQRERVLDKMLNEPASQEKLVETLYELIPADKKR